MAKVIAGDARELVSSYRDQLRVFLFDSALQSRCRQTAFLAAAIKRENVHFGMYL